jgi:ketosteroid isomerase-like protein
MDAAEGAISRAERVVREFWAHFDAKDYQALSAMMTEDALETDDLAQGWLRGPAAIGQLRPNGRALRRQSYSA